MSQCAARRQLSWPVGGGKTALDWRGIRHHLAVREVLVLWGNRAARLPSWFTQLFHSTYRLTRLFSAQMPAATGLQPLPNGRDDVLVSVPERALLEMLSDAGKGQSPQETKKSSKVGNDQAVVGDEKAGPDRSLAGATL